MAIVLDVSALAPDLATIDALARLRLRGPVCLYGVSPDLRELIELCGLDGVLCVEPRRQAEEREDAAGVEEKRQLRDPPVP